MTSKLDSYDYLVLSAVLIISISIGLYHAVKLKYKKYFKFCQRKVEVEQVNKVDENAEMNEYLIANKSMSALPIALSLLASFFSATSILGFPAEVYHYCIQYWMIVIGLSVPPIFGAFLAGPMFARLKVMSVFEYFKLRYDSTTVRLIAVGCYFVRCLVGGSVYIYGPSTTLTALTTLSSEVAVVLIGLVATFYTCIGGIKAVIWTDVK